jgi:hypothetical protein
MHVFEDGEKCGYSTNRKDDLDRHERIVSVHALVRLAALLLSPRPFVSLLPPRSIPARRPTSAAPAALSL